MLGVRWQELSDWSAPCKVGCCVARNRWRTRNQKGHRRAVWWWWGKSSPPHITCFETSLSTVHSPRHSYYILFKTFVLGFAESVVGKKPSPHITCFETSQSTVPSTLTLSCAFTKLLYLSLLKVKISRWQNFAISGHQLVWQASAMTHSPLGEIADKPALSKWLTKQTSTKSQ